MKCTNCGKELEPGAAFCTECGTKISDMNIASDPAPVESEARVPYVEEPVKEQESPYDASDVLVRKKQEKLSAKRAIVAAIIYGALSLIGIGIPVIVSLITYSGANMGSDLLKRVMQGQLAFAAIDVVQLLLAAIPIVLVLLIRKRHLWKVKTKDAVLFLAFVVAWWVINYISNTFFTIIAGQYSSSAVIASLSIARSVISFTGVGIIIGALAFSLLILAKTGAKAGCVILGVISAAIVVILTIITVGSPSLFIGLYSSSQEMAGNAALVIRIGMIVQCIISLAQLLFAVSYGFNSSSSKRWIPSFIIATLGALILQVLFILIAGLLLRSGNAVYFISGISSIGSMIALIIADVLLFAGALRNRKNI